MKTNSLIQPMIIFRHVSVLLLLAVLSFQSNAQTWSSLGTGVPDWTYSVGTFNGELYAGTATGILKFNGASWEVVGEGLLGEVDAIAVYNGELIAAGKFVMAGTKVVNFIARWNGTTWKEMAGGMDNTVTSLVVYNGKLIAGGYFTHAEVSAKYIAQWDGSHWTALGSGMGGTEGQVMALAVYGNDLVATGFFTKAGGVAAKYIAKWNGTTWSPIGTGLGYIGYSLTAYNGNLVAGGLFYSAGGVSVNKIAMWNGSTWSALGNGLDGGVYGYVMALTTYGGDLIAGGIYTTADNQPAANIAKWDGTVWTPLATYMGSGGTVQAVFGLTNYAGSIVAGGIFYSVDGTGANNVAAVTYTPSGNFIQTSAISPNMLCSGQSVTVGYTVVGNFNPGNVFTAELSDVNGSFAAPVSIGTKNSILSGNINAMIPANTITGMKYRIRVISSNPSAIGTDNGTDLTIGAPISADGPLTFCSGSSVKLSVITPAIAYQWKKDGVIISGKTAQTYKASDAGNYSCDVTNSCGVVASNVISVATTPKPTSSITVGTCSGGTVLLTSVSNPSTGVTYKWTLNGSNITGATNATYAATISGSYKCKVTIIATGCVKNSKAANVTINCKLTGDAMSDAFNVYPNPSTSYFMISYHGAVSDQNRIEVYDITGRLVESILPTEQTTRVGESYHSGIYFVKLTVNGKEEKIIKIIKE
ncbi:MAG: T9SS type A sorting domain-containing protein [Chitinophagales bacterium]|nr:T9SS type A sorting domain-containing protein [Chitinophagales bacterium]